MSLPIVAIVGRPNVGKSSLLNRLVGKRIAIVDPMSGVTRDRVSAPCPLGEGYVELMDTGGMGIEDVDDLTAHVEDQIAYALAEADVILFVVDAREGLMPLDRHVAEELRRRGKPVVLAANKVDEPDLATEAGELNALGFGEPVRVSAQHGYGMTDLTEALLASLGRLPEDAPAEAVMKLAVVGRRNAGKSTFINALAGQERVIVSSKPGTTRDSVDVTVELDGRRLCLIDTAGIRKKRRMTGELDFYAYHRALRSIRRADVVALMIDASVPISKVDKDLAREIAEQFRPVVLVVNKWDLAREVAGGQDYAEYLTKTLPEVAFAPVSLTAAATGLNVAETVRLAEQLHRQASLRVGTGELNAVIEQIVELRGPSQKAGTAPPRIYYASQIATCPPTIVCFVNDPRSFDANYQRFLLNRLREHLPYPEVPIRLIFRARRRDPDWQPPRDGSHKGRGAD